MKHEILNLIFLTKIRTANKSSLNSLDLSFFRRLRNNQMHFSYATMRHSEFIFFPDHIGKLCNYYMLESSKDRAKRILFSILFSLHIQHIIDTSDKQIDKWSISPSAESSFVLSQ